MNVLVTDAAVAAPFLVQRERRFGENIVCYYEECREGELCLTGTALSWRGHVLGEQFGSRQRNYEWFFAGDAIFTHSGFLHFPAVDTYKAMSRLRRRRMDTFAGRAIHELRPDGDSFKITWKKVLLVNNDVVINNLMFLL